MPLTNAHCTKSNATLIHYPLMNGRLEQNHTLLYPFKRIAFCSVLLHGVTYVYTLRINEGISSFSLTQTSYIS